MVKGSAVGTHSGKQEGITSQQSLREAQKRWCRSKRWRKLRCGGKQLTAKNAKNNGI